MFEGGLSGKTMTKFSTHPTKCCENCQWMDTVEASKRGHFDHYCRALPVPAYVGQPLDTYWCSMFKENE